MGHQHIAKHQHRLEGFYFRILIGIYWFQKSCIFRDIIKQQLKFSSFYFSFKNQIVYYSNRYILFSQSFLLEKYYIYCDYKNTEFNICTLILKVKLHSMFHLLNVQNKRYNILFMIIKFTFTKCFLLQIVYHRRIRLHTFELEYIYCYIYSNYKNNHGYRYIMCLYMKNYFV